MTYRLLFLSFLLSGLPIFAQNQHMSWHFGYGAGLNFSSGNPVPFSGSMLSTQESCSSMSDASGNPLFYTNAIDVWDANNAPMPNGFGLLGNESSQCIVIPKPGNPGIYYIVATDDCGSNPSNGLTYSEVDMSLNGGNGDVTAVKNIQLNAMSGEWITAVPHANCTDTWIITHGHSTNSFFFAYHVSAAGIDPVPVVTDLGIVVPSVDEIVGIMRPNPTGTKIVMTQPFYDGLIHLIDFDKATGVATGINNLYTGNPSSLTYSLEFSRSGSRLYVGEFSIGKLFQYDMTATNISSTRTQIGQMSVPGEIGQLQIAPNDKIYVAYNVIQASANYIGVINNPELTGTACSYLENAVSLATASAVNGLPWYYNPDVFSHIQPELGLDTVLCAGTTLVLSADLPNALGSTYLWSDGSTDSTLQVSTSGTYWINCQFGACPMQTDSVAIVVDAAQINHNATDTSGCAPLTVQLTGNGSPGVSGWAWNMGNGTVIHSQNADFTYTDPGTYTISLTAISANNCPVQDPSTILAEVFPVPIAGFSSQPVLAQPGEPILFTDQSAGTIVSWLWQLNDQSVSVLPECSYTPTDIQTLIASLIVTNTDGCSDTLEKTITFAPEDLIYVPNTFTPDGDRFNAIFQPVDYFGLVREFTIYNRWGELIWSGTSAEDGWNGTIDGKKAMPGVYTWEITIAINGIVSKQMEGHVTLVR